MYTLDREGGQPTKKKNTKFSDDGGEWYYNV